MQWVKPGIYRYNINTENTGVIDGPYGNIDVYGILEVIVRNKTGEKNLNVIVQKVYSYYRKISIRVCSRASSDDIYDWTKGTWVEIY